jgi:hypothetical protein
METAAWAFGGVLLLFLISVVIANMFGKRVDHTTQRILGFLCAAAAGFFGFFFTGSIALQFTGTWAGATIAVQAVSGMALFVFVLWWWIVRPPIPEVRPPIPEVEQVKPPPPVEPPPPTPVSLKNPPPG